MIIIDDLRQLAFMVAVAVIMMVACFFLISSTEPT
jgi:hypothetical protein